LSQLSKEKLLTMYKNMVTARRFDERIREMISKGTYVMYHSGIGQEAIPIGVGASLRKDDFLVPYLRGWGYQIAKGVGLNRMLAELVGKKTGLAGGKGGTHLADFEFGVLGKTGVVGAGLPVAVGAGLTAKMRGKNQVCVVFFGDGASNTGNFHESLNLASVWKLPVIFVCENNRYALSTSARVSTSVEDIADRAKGHSMPGISVDGNDVIAVYEAAREAVEKARKGQGPTLLECKTYRWMGHSGITLDLEVGYRSKEEIEQWMERCPIKRFRGWLMERSYLTDEEDKRVEEEVKKQIDEAVRFMQSSPYPTREELERDIYFEEGGEA